MFVSMLAALAGSRKPLDFDVAVINGNFAIVHRGENGDNNCAGVNAPALFGRGNSLEPMTASLLSKPREIFARYGYTGKAVRNAFALTLSALTSAELFVSGGKISNKKLAVGTALSGVYLDNAFHRKIIQESQ